MCGVVLVCGNVLKFFLVLPSNALLSSSVMLMCSVGIVVGSIGVMCSALFVW